MAEAGFMEETGRDNMFRTRLLSGIVLVILALILLITGGNVLSASLLVISIIGLHELYRALGIEDQKVSPLAASWVSRLYFLLWYCIF